MPSSSRPENNSALYGNLEVDLRKSSNVGFWNESISGQVDGLREYAMTVGGFCKLRLERMAKTSRE